MPTDQAQIREVFEQAVACESAEVRKAKLDDLCRDRPELRVAVERLLDAHEKAGSFLERPAAALGDPSAATTDSPESIPTTPTSQGCRPSEDAVLRRLGHYELLESVGKGAMGEVFRAFDAKLHRMVAIKTMAPELAAVGEARRRFVREAQAAASVVHENIVAIHAVEVDGEVPYIVMQYVDGQSLDDKIRKTGALPLIEILRIGRQLALGLAAAHKLGLVHRDVKPGNILLENGVERVKITDFGLARAADDTSLTQSGVIAGTPQFMSPEQAEGSAVNHLSDLFSFGGVLYALCTGHAPFRAPTPVATLRSVCEKTPKRVDELNSEIPRWLADVVAKLQAKHPEDRFQSATEVAELLAANLAGMPERNSPAPKPLFRNSAPAKTVPSSDQRATSSIRRWIRYGVFALAALGALLWWFPGLYLGPLGYGLVQVSTAFPEHDFALMQDGFVVARGVGAKSFRLLPGEYTLSDLSLDGVYLQWTSESRDALNMPAAAALKPAPEFFAPTFRLRAGETVTIVGARRKDFPPPKAQESRHDGVMKPIEIKEVKDSASFADWREFGEFVDPTKRASLDFPSNRFLKTNLLTTEPDELSHDLDDVRTVARAPRVLRQVNGDFRFETGLPALFVSPESIDAVTPKPAALAVGIVVWQDEKTLLRFERRCVENAAAENRVVHLRYAGSNPPTKGEGFALPGGEDADFCVERKGATFELSIRRAKGEWRSIELIEGSSLSANVKLGAYFVNASKSKTATYLPSPRLVVPPKK